MRILECTKCFESIEFRTIRLSINQQSCCVYQAGRQLRKQHPSKPSCEPTHSFTRASFSDRPLRTSRPLQQTRARTCASYSGLSGLCNWLSSSAPFGPSALRNLSESRVCQWTNSFPARCWKGIWRITDRQDFQIWTSPPIKVFKSRLALWPSPLASGCDVRALQCNVCAFVSLVETTYQFIPIWTCGPASSTGSCARIRRSTSLQIV